MRRTDILRTCRKCAVQFTGIRCLACARAASARRYAETKKINQAKPKKWQLKAMEPPKEPPAPKYKRGPEELREYAAEYRKKNKEKVLAATNAWRAANRERVQAYEAEQRRLNPEKNRQRASKWAKENPDLVRVIQQNRRARKLESGGKLSPGLAKRLFSLQKGRCACCGEPLGESYHLDHIMPLALGGTNTDDNMQLLRAICNSQKHSKHPVDFMRSRGFLI